VSRWNTAALCLLLLAMSPGCGGATTSAPPTATAQNLVLITIDTLRADHVGAYGYARARTPTLDGLAAGGTLFERAYSAAPITLTSHATLMSGRYPPGHGARDNGMHVSAGVPTLATELHARGFRTGAFVAAFPLDHQFGLDRGFDVYSDRLPRGPDGRLVNERPASQVVDEAIAWLNTVGSRQSAVGSPSTDQAPSTEHQAPFFVWVHLFEPHAPYGDAASGRPTLERYDDEIAVADSAVGRLVSALAPVRAQTLVVVAGDHGEAFGEHGEYAHSIFVYDTTLHVPLIMNGPAIRGGARVSDPVTLADVAPTAMRLLGLTLREVDGIDLATALGGAAIPKRELYAESFAPLVEFGWAPLRSIRSGPWKFIAAPKPELFDIDRDASEDRNVAASQPSVTSGFASRASRYADAGLPGTTAPDPQAAERLRALGYSSGSRQDDNGTRPDPKDRRELAARIAQVTSGELSGAALVSALEGIVHDDPRNGQAHLRLGFARLQAGDCARAEPEFHAAVSAGLPSADLYIGLASCLGRRSDLAGAQRALDEARRLEPDNPAVAANTGILLAAKSDWAGAIAALSSALRADPDLHEARFNLALAYAKSGDRVQAVAAARELLTRLPAEAPQRSEVERLLRALQQGK
jgi:choline-sulfatase